MARPYKEPPEPLDIIKPIRITASTQARIRAIAEAANLPESEIIRRKLDGIEIRNFEAQNLANELRDLRQELARQGGLIKNLYSKNPFDPAATKILLNTQTKVMESILPILDKVESAVEGISKNDNRQSGEKKRR